MRPRGLNSPVPGAETAVYVAIPVSVPINGVAHVLAFGHGVLVEAEHCSFPLHGQWVSPAAHRSAGCFGGVWFMLFRRNIGDIGDVGCDLLCGDRSDKSASCEGKKGYKTHGGDVRYVEVGGEKW
jgi:hypothetical protein